MGTPGEGTRPSFSTNSISRMLPSGCRSAENAFLGLKSALQAKRLFSSATSCIARRLEVVNDLPEPSNSLVLHAFALIPP